MEVLSGLDSVLSAVSSERSGEPLAYLKGCTDEDAGNMQKVGLSFELVGARMAELKQLDATSAALIARALAARISSCFFCVQYAEHLLLHPALAAETIRSRATFGADASACAATVLLVYRFMSLAQPADSVAELHRVEDQLEGWALQFKQYAACQQASSSSEHPYDVGACRDTLLKPDAVLTVGMMTTYAGDGDKIWSWRTPAENGNLRWRILPPAGGQSDAKESPRACAHQPQLPAMRWSSAHCPHAAATSVTPVPFHCTHRPLIVVLLQAFRGSPADIASISTRCART